MSGIVTILRNNHLTIPISSHLYTFSISCIMKEVESGDTSVILISPEAATDDSWMKIWRLFRKKVCVVTCDEVHCIPLW